MTDKDLRRLSRAELLDILYEQRKRYEDSLAENQALRQQLEDRTLRIASAGSIAEAAIQVNGVFEAAQAAADQYLASVKAATAEMVQKTDEAQRQRETIMQDAKQQAGQIVQDAQAQADRILAEAGAQVDARWAEFQKNADALQQTSVQNCLTAPPMTGPRQMTGSVSFGRSRLMDMTLTPSGVSAGSIPSSLPTICSCRPKALGMDGPVTSASRMAVL